MSAQRKSEMEPMEQLVGWILLVILIVGLYNAFCG